MESTGKERKLNKKPNHKVVMFPEKTLLLSFHSCVLLVLRSLWALGGFCRGLEL